MANTISPTGFSLARNIVSNSFAAQTNTYFIPASDTNAYYLGDAVISATGTDVVNGFPQIAPATGAASIPVRGVIMGVLPTPALGQQPSLSGNAPLALEQIYVPAAKQHDYYVMVCDDPNQLFEIQDNGLGAVDLPTIAGYASKTALFTPVAPTGNKPISATVMTFAPANLATSPLRIMGLSQRPAPGGGNQLAPFARWIVKFNLHELNQPTAGV